VKIFHAKGLHPADQCNDGKLSGHYFNSILASLEARKNGYDEALILDFQGNIAEGPGENNLFRQNKTLITAGAWRDPSRNHPRERNKK